MFRQKLYFIVVCFALFGFSVRAQKKNPVLFTVQGKEVKVAEFTKIYEKNLSLVQDVRQKDIENYLELYINYKLKVQEALDLQMDTVGSFIREFTKYKNQLIEPYLKDKDLEENLLKEAYERMQLEINASHILVKLPKNPSPQDTLQAYQTIMDARARVLQGETFANVAKAVSNDPSAAKNGGNLGYFSVFQMVYPFENMAYQTPVGEVSMPFQTRFGYHIIMVHDKRVSKGEVEVAHIMLKGDYAKNQPMIDNIKKQLDEGADFTTLAKTYSQDGSSASKGGLLPRFGSGRMIPSFEKVAFSLAEEGAVSEPFKTEFGWHIIKLVKKYPIGTFEEMKSVLQTKIDQGQRTQFKGNSILGKLYNQYHYTVHQDVLDAFSKDEWFNDLDIQTDKALLDIDSKTYTANDFYQYYKVRNKRAVNQVFDEFKKDMTLAYYKETLPGKYPNLAETLKEYREGILLFDLMQQKIWGKAEKDSLGLINYFNAHSDAYQWGRRAKITVASVLTDDQPTLIQYLKDGMSLDSIKTHMGKDDLLAIQEEVLELSKESLPEGLKLESGATLWVPVEKQFQLYYVKEILPPVAQTLDEVKGKVMSDYQDFLEKEWIIQLKSKYNVQVNKKSLKKLKAQYKS